MLRTVSEAVVADGALTSGGRVVIADANHRHRAVFVLDLLLRVLQQSQVGFRSPTQLMHDLCAAGFRRVSFCTVNGAAMRSSGRRGRRAEIPRAGAVHRGGVAPTDRGRRPDGDRPARLDRAPGRPSPVGADSLLADRVGRQAADRLDAVLAPTVRVGFAPEHAELTGTLTLPAETLTDMAVAIAESLAEQGFRLVVLVSIHGGNAAPLRIAVGRFNLKQTGTRACAPRGEIGPDPGRHSGRWLTSVMLALHPELVDLDAAAEDLRAELRTADAHRCTVYLERYVSSILDEVRRVLLDRHPLN